MQVPECREHRQHEGDRVAGGQGIGITVVGGFPFLERCAQRRSTHVLHHDVRVVLVLGEVVDPHDVRVVDLREEPQLRSDHVDVAGVEQALEHDPATVDPLVAGEIDPPEAAVGDASLHLVLTADEGSGCELGREGERVPALGAEPVGAAGLAVASTADGLVASGIAAEALALRNAGVGQHRIDRVADHRRWDLDPPPAEAVAAGRGGTLRPRPPGRAPRPAGSGRARRGGRHVLRCLVRDRGQCGGAATVAVALVDLAGRITLRAGALHRGTLPCGDVSDTSC